MIKRVGKERQRNIESCDKFQTLEKKIASDCNPTGIRKSCRGTERAQKKNTRLARVGQKTCRRPDERESVPESVSEGTSTDLCKKAKTPSADLTSSEWGERHVTNFCNLLKSGGGFREGRQRTGRRESFLAGRGRSFAYLQSALILC